MTIVELLPLFLQSMWATTLQLAPWLLLGSAVAGVLHGVLPKDFIRRQLTGRFGVVKAVALGVPLPLCSCGVIPAGLGLRRDGASRGSAIAFLTSTPQTGVDSILVSASFLGWPFALFKVGAAVVSGLIGGWLVDATDANASIGVPEDEPQRHREACNPEPDATRVDLRDSLALAPRLQGLLEHTIEILRSVWRWWLLGGVLSAIINVLVPEAWLHNLGSLGAWGAGLAALAVSLPLYVCATASVPIAAALVAGGMPTGAALVFLMAGPATNVATLGAVVQGFGRRALAIYLLNLVVISLLAGVLFDSLLETPVEQALAHSHAPGPLALASAVLLIGLALNFALSDLRRGWSNSAQRESGENLVEIFVQGMTCSGCQGTVERSLRTVAGVRALEVSLEPGRVRVAGSMSAEAVVAAIEGAGYGVQR